MPPSTRTDGQMPGGPLGPKPSTAYVYTATLAQLTCNVETATAKNVATYLGSEEADNNIPLIRQACQTIETPSAYSREELAEALALMDHAIRPYPALFIQEWFWQTNPGRHICLAEWSLYSELALFPVQIARMFWGVDVAIDRRRMNKALRRVNMLMQPTALGKWRLRAYHRPNFEGHALQARTGKPSKHSVYALRPAVEAMLASGEYEGIEKDRRLAERIVRWHDKHPGQLRDEAWFANSPKKKEKSIADAETST